MLTCAGTNIQHSRPVGNSIFVFDRFSVTDQFPQMMQNVHALLLVFVVGREPVRISRVVSTAMLIAILKHT